MYMFRHTKILELKNRIEISNNNCNRSIESVLLVDLENNIIFNLVKAMSKGVMYNAMELDEKPHRQQVINDVKHLLYGKLQNKLKCKQVIYDIKWIFIVTYIDNNSCK